MIQVLGIKRILALVFLIALNAAFAATVYMYTMPQGEKLKRDLRSTRAQIAGKRSETERMRNEFDQIQQQKTYFEALQAAGFMSDQNRLVARRRIMNIQQYTKILKVSYNIKAASVVKNPTADKAKYVVLSSRISADVESLDDIDVYNFIYWMRNAFPGHIAVEDIQLNRTLDLNEATLRAIGSGAATPLVKGRVEFLWRTMVPKSEVQKTEEFDGEGF